MAKHSRFVTIQIEKTTADEVCIIKIIFIVNFSPMGNPLYKNLPHIIKSGCRDTDVRYNET